MSSIRKGTGRRVFAAGALIYVVSFFLVAVGPYPARGYNCALAALALPIAEPENPSQPASWLDRVEFRFVAIKVSGLINVVFILATICQLSARSRALFKALRVLVLLMMPFCWAAFHTEHFYPREGYFFWILGMMLVLFPGKYALDRASSRSRSSGVSTVENAGL